MQEELLYQIALTMIPELCCKSQNTYRTFRNASPFPGKEKGASAVEGNGDLCARRLKEWKGFSEAEAEIVFTEKHHLQTLFISDKDYPQRLLHCYDPPTLLYYRGNANLNSTRIVSIVGTRNHTEYGKQVTEQLVHSLQSQQV